MRLRRLSAISLLLISIAILTLGTSFNLTGNAIGNNYYLGNGLLFSIFGFIVLVGGLILFVHRDGLEYLVIPTGWENPRIKKAKSEIRKRQYDHQNFDKIIITGHVDKGKLEGSHRQKIYNAMKNYGVKPSQMKILDGIDSEEDILYLGKVVKPGDTIYFDTFPLHYREYKTLIGKAQQHRQFPRNVDTKIVPIKQGLREIVYGVAGWMEEVMKRRKLEYKGKRHEGTYDKVKTKFRRTLNNS